MINLSSSTPAAPTGATNVTWQQDASGDVSAYLPLGTIPNYTTAAKLALTGITGQVVFDTTLGKLCVYTGSAWQTITSA